MFPRYLNKTSVSEDQETQIGRYVIYVMDTICYAIILYTTRDQELNTYNCETAASLVYDTTDQHYKTCSVLCKIDLERLSETNRRPSRYIRRL